MSNETSNRFFILQMKKNHLYPAQKWETMNKN